MIATKESRRRPRPLLLLLLRVVVDAGDDDHHHPSRVHSSSFDYYLMPSNYDPLDRSEGVNFDSSKTVLPLLLLLGVSRASFPSPRFAKSSSTMVGIHLGSLFAPR